MTRIDERLSASNSFETPRESRHQTLFEISGRYGRFALELRSFQPEDSPEPRTFYWLTRQKPGARSTGVSIRISEMRPLIEVLTRILDEPDDTPTKPPDWLQRHQERHGGGR